MQSGQVKIDFASSENQGLLEKKRICTPSRPPPPPTPPRPSTPRVDPVSDGAWYAFFHMLFFTSEEHKIITYAHVKMSKRL